MVTETDIYQDYIIKYQRIIEILIVHIPALDSTRQE